MMGVLRVSIGGRKLGVPPGSASSTGIGDREWEEAVGAGGVLQKSG